MYKYISIVLLVLVLIAGGLYGAERWSHKKTKTLAHNLAAEVTGMVVETDTARSRLGTEIKGLELENEMLQDIIDSRDEEVLALGRISVEWKDRYFKIKNAKQSVVNEEGEPIVVGGSDPTEPEHICNKAYRFKVEFEQKEEALTVSGFTLTNPPYAELKLDWHRKLNLNIILTKTDDGHFRLYADPEKSDAVPVELEFVVDPSVLERKWYENIAFNTMIAGGDGGFQLGIGAHYNILDNMYLGPMVIVGINDSLQPRIYGAVVLGYWPWRLR